MANSEINITITSLTGQAESISMDNQRNTLMDLAEFAVALLGIQPNSQLTFLKDGKVFFTKTSSTGMHSQNRSLKEAGIQHGDLILVSTASNDDNNASTQNAMQATSNTRAGTTSSGMTLDFSSLLNSANNSTQTPKPATSGLTFNIPGLSAFPAPKTLVEWEGMTLDEAIQRNPNPDLLVQILFNEKKHPYLMKELNHHSPSLAKKLKDAGINRAARIWREEMMKGGLKSAIQNSQAKSVEDGMKQRLNANPMDEEANKYFGEKIRKKNVEDQYRQMMETYPESMGRVLMLYIETKVNSIPMQAFVDSGAQSTIMSASAAEKCGLLHLLDTRFEGTAVGVGTGKILGRIHITPITVNGNFFPCTITVMDDNGKGLGDKNMEFLFGLDMLKRHRCKIDLERNVLAFRLEDGKEMVTPFLHEKDLDATKGGTKGFDAEQSNIELQQTIERSMKKKDDNNMELDDV